WRSARRRATVVLPAQAEPPSQRTWASSAGGRSSLESPFMSLPAAFPAGAFAPAEPAAEPLPDPFAALPIGLPGRLDAVCLRAAHHPLEYEELSRLLAALRARAPRAEVHLHLRSAVGDLEPFRALPVDRVEWLTERRGRGTLAEGLRRRLGQ